MTDDRTPNLNLALPHQDNLLLQDVVRLRSALTAIDSELHGILSKFGAANGLAQLDSSGKVPASQLPSYVDDVLEFASLAAFPGAGEQGKIYVALDTGEQYRWSGSAYVVISPSPGSTDDVPEGSVNRYFTDARARAAQQPATASTLGVVKVGANVSVAEDGTISVPSLPFSELTGTPTTLAGYGITDAARAAEVVPKSGGSFDGGVSAPTMSDEKGNLRDIPQVRSVAAGGALVATDAGGLVALTGNCTIAVSTFSDGDVVMILNPGAADVTITITGSAYVSGIDAARTSVTLRKRGMVTVIRTGGILWLSGAVQ